MLKIGDKVRFLNESGEGTVMGFQNKNMVIVLIEEGFEIPIRITELVAVAGEDEIKNEQVILEHPVVNEVQSAKIEGKEAVFMAIAPDEMVFSDTFTLYLINNSLYHLAYTLSIKDKKGYTGLHCGILSMAEAIECGTFGQEEINHWECLIIQLLLYKAGQLQRVQMPLEKQLVIKNNRLQQTHLLKPAPITGMQAHLFEIADLSAPPMVNYADYEPTFSAKTLRSKTMMDKGKQKTEDKDPLRINPKNGYMEIDLHIEELMEEYSGLSNGEIVQIQLKHCKKAIDTAIQRHAGKITLIHGVGNGTLKREVRDLLRTYNDIQFYDAPAEKYGYGATEVKLK